jgi:hypothetical protein
MLQSEEELDDTGITPVKNKDAEMTDHDSSDASAKRRLSLDFSNPIFEDEGEGTLPMSTENDTRVEKMTTTDTDKDRTKHTRKNGADSSSLGSAGSLEGSVRSQ